MWGFESLSGHRVLRFFNKISGIHGFFVLLGETCHITSFLCGQYFPLLHIFPSSFLFDVPDNMYTSVMRETTWYISSFLSSINLPTFQEMLKIYYRCRQCFFCLLPLNKYEPGWQRSNCILLLTLHRICKVSRNHHTWKYLPIVIQFIINFTVPYRYITTQ